MFYGHIVPRIKSMIYLHYFTAADVHCTVFFPGVLILHTYLHISSDWLLADFSLTVQTRSIVVISQCE